MSESEAPEAAPTFLREAPASGRVEAVSPLIRRLVCPNSGPFTQSGTCTYLVGHGRVAVIDPGPDHPAHRAALLAALDGETIDAILVTHTHRDHSPGARPLAAATGAPILGCGPQPTIGAPVAALSARAPGEWSRWVWVTRIASTVSPARAASSAA